MTAKVIQGYLLADTISRTAQDVMNANPGRFADASKVDPFMYLSLKDILSQNGVIGAEQNYSDFVVYKYGTDLTMANLGIEMAYVAEEAENAPEGYRSDEIGAEFGLLKILCRLNPADADQNVNMTEQADLRIRDVIDANIRAQTKKIPAVLDPTGIDNSVMAPIVSDPNAGVICRWMKFLTPPTGPEVVSVYSLQYTRLFPR